MAPVVPVADDDAGVDDVLNRKLLITTPPEEPSPANARL